MSSQAGTFVAKKKMAAAQEIQMGNRSSVDVGMISRYSKVKGTTPVERYGVY